MASFDFRASILISYFGHKTCFICSLQQFQVICQAMLKHSIQYFCMLTIGPNQIEALTAKYSLKHKDYDIGFLRIEV